MKKASLAMLAISLFSAAFVGYFWAVVINHNDISSQPKLFLKSLDYRLSNGRIQGLIFHEHLLNRSLDIPLQNYDWISNTSYLPIAHGLGAQLYAGANTLRTFEESYRRGFRVFEVDISLTTDGHLVCFHGDSESSLNHLAFNDYLQIQARAGLQPCEFLDLVKLVRMHPDIHFVLDVKNRFEDSYSLIRMILKNRDIGSHFIPQIYYFSEASQFARDSIMAGPILTSYRSRMSTDRLIQGARILGIKVVTLNQERTRELKRVPDDLFLLSHPVDDAFEAAELRRRGFRGIYTSYVAPGSIPEVFTGWTSDCEPGQIWRNCNNIQDR